MHLSFDANLLLVFHLFGGLVILFLWAGLLGEALIGRRPALAGKAIGPLTVLGLVHPAAALAAVDLARLGRPDEELAPPFTVSDRARRLAVAATVAGTLLATAAWLDTIG